MRFWPILLAAPLLAGAARSHPPPILSLDGFRNVDGTITLTWLLPSDPSIVGVTIDRERLDDSFSVVRFVLAGPVTTYTDTSALGSHSYRYWVYTRNSFGELSQGAFVTFFSGDDFDDDHFTCSTFTVSAPPRPVPLGAALLAALLLPILARRRI